MFKQPKVYLIGYTEVDNVELTRYLRETDQLDFLDDFDRTPLSRGERLCSFYAKLCYKSLALGHNENVTKVRDIESNLRGCFDAGHGSVFEHFSLNFVATDVSRVFTHELVRHRVGTAYCLAGDTEVWSGSKVNGQWNGVKRKWTLRELFEKTKTSHGRSRLSLCTVRCFNGTEFVPAKIKNVFESGEKPIFKITLFDGSTIRCSQDHRFLTKEGWIAVKEIKLGLELATNGQFVAGHSPWNKGEVGVNSFTHTQQAKEKISAGKTGSNNPQWNGGLSLKKKNAQALRGSSCENCGTNKDLQIHHIDRNHWNDSLENLKTLCNSCHQKLHYQEDGSPSKLVPKWIAVIDIRPDGFEMTYDLEVLHPSHNFVANGFVTHNSQTSGRYVSIDELDIVFDPILEPVRTEAEELIKLTETYLRRMREKLIKDGDSFDRKKKVTSAIRRFAPNGQTNEIGFSVNIRQLRHMIHLRTSVHAEWEIRLVFNQVANIVLERYPLMLYGMERNLQGEWEYVS